MNEPQTGEPVDDTHRAALDARAHLNRAYATVREVLSTWEPRPCPPPEEWP